LRASNPANHSTLTPKGKAPAEKGGVYYREKGIRGGRHGSNMEKQIGDKMIGGTPNGQNLKERDWIGEGAGKRGMEDSRSCPVKDE